VSGTTANEKGGASVGWIVEHAGSIKRSPTISFMPEPEAEALFCPVISADDHLLEPPTLFSERLPAKLRDDAPRVEMAQDGGTWWVIGESRIPVLATDGAAGRAVDNWRAAVAAYGDFRPGVQDPLARLKDMDLSGVWASLCFPATAFGFAGTQFCRMKDPALGLACLKAYNDWVVEEWCAAAPGRYIPCQLTWLSDASLAAEEIYRNAGRGVHAVSFSEEPEYLGFASIYDASWEPFFRACEETGTVLNLHVGSSGKSVRPSSKSPDGVLTALFPLCGIQAMVDWIYAHIPLSYPGIKIALSEGGVSWVPMAFERLARALRRNGASGWEWPLDAPTPMELAARNFWFTSIEDPSAFHALDIIGVDHVMVETDYPHPDTTWPTSQDLIRRDLAHLPDDVVRKICYQNAADLYHHPGPPGDLLARSDIGLPGTDQA
jgi:predicted TIM-barrel fold metal-dependent hydrolase